MKPNMLHNVRLIAGREFHERVYKRIFVITTVVIAVLALVAMLLPTAIQYLTRSDSRVGIVVLDLAGPVAGQDSAGVVRYLDETLNAPTSSAAPAAPVFTATLATVTDPAVLVARVKDGTVDSALVITRAAGGDLTFQLTTKREPSSSTVQQVRQAANFLAASDRLQRAGLDASQQQAAFRPAQFEVSSTSSSTFNNGKSDAENLVGYGITTTVVVLMYVMIVLYGQWIAGGVVEEKSSRVMEIMINAATPMQLLSGKILGVAGAAFTQMGAIIVAALLGLAIQPPLNEALLGSASGGLPDFAAASASLLIFAFVFFILAFALYGVLHAGMGALVSRVEDVSQVVAPLQMILLPGYLLTILALTSINEPWVRVASFFPLFTPMMMLARIGIGDVAAWEVALALALMLVTILLGTALAARLYRNGILYYGQRPKLLQMLRRPTQG